MPESVNYNSEEGFIHVLSFGEVKTEDCNISMKEIINISQKTNCSSVLVDARNLISSPESVDLYTFGEDLPVNLKFAVIKVEINSMDLKFLESVGNRRGKQIRVFDDYRKGIKWLIDDA